MTPAGILATLHHGPRFHVPPWTVFAFLAAVMAVCLALDVWAILTGRADD